MGGSAVPGEMDGVRDACRTMSNVKQFNQQLALIEPKARSWMRSLPSGVLAAGRIHVNPATYPMTLLPNTAFITRSWDRCGWPRLSLRGKRNAGW